MFRGLGLDTARASGRSTKPNLSLRIGIDGLGESGDSVPPHAPRPSDKRRQLAENREYPIQELCKALNRGGVPI